jgi:hypothetical protein
MFNENLKRNLNKRFQLKLVRKNDIPLNSWEISNTINQLTSYYFKNELINSISLAINQGIKPENIFILSESFSLNKNYEKIDVLTIPEELKQLIIIGDPISLIPNKDIFYLNLLFKTYREINEALYKSKPRLRLSEDVLNISFSFISKGYKPLGDYINNYIKDLVSNARSNKTAKGKNDNLDSVINKTNKIIQKFSSKYDAYEKDEINIKLIKENLIEEIKEKNEIKNEEIITKKYFDKFYYYLSRVSRPIVGIYYKENNSIQIIGKSQINKKKRDALFFDTKEVSHNSPLQFIVEAGLGLGQLAIEKERLKMEKEKHEWEKRNAKLDADLKELELLEKQLEVYNKINEQLQSEGINEVSEIQNLYIKQRMIESKGKIFNGYHRLVDRNQLEIDHNRTSIIDIRA